MGSGQDASNLSGGERGGKLDSSSGSQPPRARRTRHTGRWLRALTALIALGAAQVASADGLGLGIGIEPLNFASGAAGLFVAGRNSAPVSFYMPIQVGPRLRLEPSAAYFHVSMNGGNSASRADAYGFSATAVGIGGLFYLAPPAPLGFYMGARLTAAFYSGGFVDHTTPGKPWRKVTETDMFFAPVAGAEYAISRRFAVAAEFQLPLAFYGTQSSKVLGATAMPNIGYTRLNTSTVLFLRYSF